jgi:hypothetical protein
MKCGELWEKNGRRWGVTAVSAAYADLDDGTHRTACRLDEVEANGWKRINGHACLWRSPPVEFIRVWAYHQAPIALRDLSTNGGDEDWIAVVPYGMHRPLWMEEGTAFGCCSVDAFEILAGTVYIGSHS